MSSRPTIVVSAVNLVEGGTASILLDCARAFDELPVNVIYLIHPKLREQFQNRKVRLYSWPKRSWFLRVIFEKILSARIEKELKPDLWLSLHDITPRLKNTPSIVYCHNASPFYKGNLLHALRFDCKFVLFRMMYSLLYSWGIHSNRAVVVQQRWLREKFAEEFGMPLDRIVVAHPVFVPRGEDGEKKVNLPLKQKPFRLLYPLLPRFFKNVEVLGEALEMLQDSPLEIAITLSGTENRYARYLHSRFSNLPNLKWLGRLPRDELLQMYEDVDALVFPSMLESWGLPMSEFRRTGKPIVAADRDYAREVLAGYSNAWFVDPLDPAKMAEVLRAVISGSVPMGETHKPLPEQPFCATWKEFVTYCTDRIQ